MELLVLLDPVLDVRAVLCEVVGPRRQRTALARVLALQTLAVLLLLPTLLILPWCLQRLRLLQIQRLNEELSMSLICFLVPTFMVHPDDPVQNPLSPVLLLPGRLRLLPC